MDREKMDTNKQAKEAKDIIAGTPIMPETAFEIGIAIGLCEGWRARHLLMGNPDMIAQATELNARNHYNEAARLMEEARNG